MFQRSVKSQQRRMRMLSFKVDGTGTASLDGSDKNSVSLVDNGVGEYTITFDEAYRRPSPEVHITSHLADTAFSVPMANLSVSGFKVFATDLANVAKDAEFSVLVVGSDDPDFI